MHKPLEPMAFWENGRLVPAPGWRRKTVGRGFERIPGPELPGEVIVRGPISPYEGRSPPEGSKPGRLWFLLPAGQPDAATWVDEAGFRWAGAPPAPGVPEGWRPPWQGTDPIPELDRLLRELERRYASTLED